MPQNAVVDSFVSELPPCFLYMLFGFSSEAARGYLQNEWFSQNKAPVLKSNSEVTIYPLREFYPKQVEGY